MKLEVFSLGRLMTNAYLLSDEQSKRGIIIDPGESPTALLNKVKVENIKVEAILLTHAHFDHIAGLNEVREETGAPVYIHPAEQDWLTNAEKNGSALWTEVPTVTCQRADEWFEEGQVLTFFHESFEVIHTPGHSPGSVTLKHSSGIFSGDVLFMGSVGRTDLPGGDHQQLMNTLETKIKTLPSNTQVYPGHGPATIVGTEIKTNPFLT